MLSTAVQWCFLPFSLNMEVRAKQLVAVVGHVGAGKSSLVQALLGEMEKISGSVLLKVCYMLYKYNIMYFNVHCILFPSSLGSDCICSPASMDTECYYQG